MFYTVHDFITKCKTFLFFVTYLTSRVMIAFRIVFYETKRQRHQHLIKIFLIGEKSIIFK